MSELKSKVNEILEDLGGRIRNPLILTFILVWLYYHWTLIYQILTIDNSSPIEFRLGIFKSYIKQNRGWCGMIGIPIFWAFIALPVYYVIGIAAQGIKVIFAKRLNAYMLAKIDTGNFALKTELELEKSNLMKVNKELEMTKQANASMVAERGDIV